MAYRMFFYFILFSSQVFAQNKNDLNQGIRVEYKCLFNIKFEREKQFNAYEGFLTIQSGMSTYYSIPEKLQKSAEGSLDIIIETDTFLRVVKNSTRDEILFGTTSMNGKEIYFRDSLFPMIWNLEKESKMIDSLECFKATTLFKGRNYVAWYCPKIPVPDGPWKLGGLPGLVIEAFDENKDLYFIARGINLHISNSPTLIYNDFEKYPDYPGYIKYMNDVLQKLQSSMSAQDSPDCVSCQTKTTFKVYLWEKVFF
jgi:GLPGLI family protein